MASNREKLELTLNEPAVVEFLYDKPRIGEGQYGTYWIWGVRHKGIEKTFFAPSASIEQEIEAIRKTSNMMVITQSAENLPGGKLRKITTVAPYGSSTEAYLQREFNTSPVPMQAVITDTSPASLMRECLKQAETIVTSHQFLEKGDILTVAIELFKRS